MQNGMGNFAQMFQNALRQQQGGGMPQGDRLAVMPQTGKNPAISNSNIYGSGATTGFVPNGPMGNTGQTPTVDQTKIDNSLATLNANKSIGTPDTSGGMGQPPYNPNPSLGSNPMPTNTMSAFAPESAFRRPGM